MHLLHAQEGVRSTNDFEPSKITCLQVIREGYEGLPMSYPCKVFVDSVKKEIYVVDSGNSRILVYTHDFYPLLSIGKSDGIQVPVGLAVDPEGYLFIAQSPTGKQKKGRISVLNPCLRWKKDIFFDGFEGADNFNPINIAINDKGHLYVTGTAYRGAVVLDKDGRFSHLLTPTDKLGKGAVEKATICDVEIGNRGHIYLLSEDMGRIYVYDPQEQFLFKFGQKGGGSGKLSRPRGMGVDSRNKRIYVIDYMRHTASAYSSEDGRFLFEFGGKGWAKGWFQYPTDIAVDTLGNVLVADTFNNRVQVLKIEGAPSVAKAEEAKPRVPAIEELVERAEPGVPVTEELAEQKPTKYYILTANMNLREKGSIESEVIELMKKGEELEILDQYKQDELTSWYLIKTRSGLTGWFCGVYHGKVKFTEKER